MSDSLEQNTELLMRIEAELKKALKHCQVAKRQFEAGDVPHASAHALAVQGHLSTASKAHATLAEHHSAHAILEDGD